MKANIRFFVALGLASTIFFSCDKKDKNNGDNNLPDNPAYIIKASDVENSTEQVKTVKGITYINNEEYFISSAEYKDKGFSLELPAPVSDSLLMRIGDDFTEASTISVSDLDARILSVDQIKGYDANGEHLGYFEYGNTDIANTIWVYADRDLSITGQELESDEDEVYNITYEVSVKKGWNILYFYSSETTDPETEITTYNEKITSTQNPAITLSWSFYGFMVERPAKTVQKSIFKLKK